MLDDSDKGGMIPSPDEHPADGSRVSSEGLCVWGEAGVVEERIASAIVDSAMHWPWAENWWRRPVTCANGNLGVRHVRRQNREGPSAPD